MADNLNAAVGLDTTAFRAGVTDLKNQVKAIEASFRASAAVMGDWSKSTEGLSARTTSLEEKLKLQKQALERLNTAYKEAVSQQGADSKSAQSLANQMYSMEKQIESTERELEKYNQKLKSQQSSWEQLSQKMNTFSERASALGKGISDIGKTLTTGITTPIVGIAGAAVKLGDDFEAQMSRVKAISGATGEEFEALTEQAKQLGADTAFSATEAAQGMENLASAGFTTKEIMEAMPGMLDLAASSGEDLANSADIAASTLRGFGLAADQAGHVADVLAKNAADTNAAVADTGAAMKYIAPVAKNAGWALEEVTAAIGEMADAGIKGEQAGTTLRGALTNLMNPSKQQADAMKAIGFSAYDANGKMKSLSQIIGELSTKTSKLTDEQRDNVIATIMGTNSLSGMQVLLKDGKTNLDKLTKSLRNSDGAAKEMAVTMQDNTKGAVEQMKGALETAAISIQESLAPTITSIANKIGELADKFSQLSPAQQEMIIKFAAIAASIGPILIVIGKMATGIGAITKAISTVSGAIAVVKTGVEAATPAVGGLASVFSFMTGPIGLVILGITAVVAAFALLWNNCEGFRNFWIGLWNGIKSAAQAVGTWFSGPFVDFFKNAWSGIQGAFSAVGSWFSGVFGAAASGIQAAWSGVTGFFSGVWNGITRIFSVVGGWFRNVFSTAWNGIKSVWSTVTGWFQGVWNGITKVFSVVGGWFSSTFGAAWIGIKNIWSAATGWFTGIWNGIKGAFKPNMISDAFGRAWGAIKNAWGGAAGWFRGIWDGISAGFRGAVNAIIKGMNWLIRGLNKIHFSIPDWVPGAGGKSFGIHIGEIPLLAKGGIIDKATLAMIGEAGKEAVIPLERNTAWIKSLAQDLATALSGASISVSMPARMQPAYAGTAPSAPASYTFYQYNTSPRALSPAETARQTRNLLRQASLQSRRR